MTKASVARVLARVVRRIAEWVNWSLLEWLEHTALRLEQWGAGQ